MTGNSTILIIDDDPSNIEVIINLIKKKFPDFVVLSSCNSKLGLEIAIAEKPDIIITDWEMPEMNGIELIELLKNNEETENIPIIMASGINTNTADIILAFNTGACGFICKPLDEAKLVAIIKGALKQRIRI